MGNELKTIGFATAVCLICSLLLAGTHSALKDEQEQNAKDALKAKVLIACGVEVLDERGKKQMSKTEISDLFNAQMEGKVLSKNAELVDIKIEDLLPEQINERSKEDGLKEYYPFYVYTDAKTGKKRYAIHISGMGLWSVVKGYLALEEDYSKIAGIAFYDHAETPGLGGEIEKDFFTERFTKDKSMTENGIVKPFRIIKPGQKGDNHCVDGISGATMTCKGVEALINSDYAVYHKYFQTIGN